MTTIALLSPEERRGLLLGRLRDGGRLVAAELARELRTSEDTIRRDLRELAAAGLCRRVHGGALPLSPALGSFAERSRRPASAREALAAVGAGLVREGQTVLLDGGTTNLALARKLPPGLRATLVTPSPAAALALAEHPGVEVILIGGRLDKEELVTGGAAALEAVQALRADLCILGVCALDPKAGIGAAGFEDAHLKRAMLAASAESVALVAADKLGTVAPHIVAPASALARLVVERGAPEALLARFAEQGLAVLRA